MLGFALLCPSLFCSPVKRVGLHSALKDMHTPRHNWAYQSWITAASAVFRLCFVLPQQQGKGNNLVLQPSFSKLPVVHDTSFAFCNGESLLHSQILPQGVLHPLHSHATSLLPPTGLDRHCLVCRCLPKSQGHLICTIAGCSKSQLTQNH